MPFVVVLMSVGLPIAMFLGGFAAWRIARTGDRPDANKPAWKDDSLEAWRRERDAASEAERQRREAAPIAEVETGSTEEQAQPTHHQRIGG